MTKLNQIYKCEICRNIVEILHEGAGELVCCNQPMKLFEEKQEDEGQEKHVPIIKKTEKGVKVKVGSIEHPMTEEHYIGWIEVLANGKVYRKFLNPNQKPKAEFLIQSDNITARCFCNLHGLWRNK